MTELDTELKHMNSKEWLDWMLKNDQNNDIRVYGRVRLIANEDVIQVEDVASDILPKFNQVIKDDTNALNSMGYNVQEYTPYTLNYIEQVLRQKDILEPEDDGSFGAWLMRLGSIQATNDEILTAYGAYIKFGKRHISWVLTLLK